MLVSSGPPWGENTVRLSPAFREFALYHFFFTEVPTLVPVFTDRYLKRIFTFAKKGRKQKKHFVFILQGAITEAVCILSTEWHGQAPSLGTTLVLN